MGGVGGVLACALAVAAAGGCSSSSGGGTAAPSTTIATAQSGPIPVSVCSLASPDQVKAVIGKSVAGAEADQRPTYKTCSWTSGGTTLTVSTIRKTATQAGFFGSSVLGLTQKTITGVGQEATYSTGKSSRGLNENLLVSDSGTISLAVDVQSSGSLGSADSMEKSTGAIAQSVFTQLGAG
jgi:hypothetical protein